MAWSIVGKIPKRSKVNLGSGTSFNTILVMIPNVPSEPITIFSNGGIARGEVLDLDKLTNIDIMQLSKKAVMGDLAGTIKEGVASWRDNIAGNSSLCRGIADKLDVAPENVASAGIATTLALAGLGIGYGCKKLAEKFLQKKKAKEAGLEGPSPEKRLHNKQTLCKYKWQKILKIPLHMDILTIEVKSTK